MGKTIQQSVQFPGVDPARLFDTYIDAKKHSAAIRAKASVSRAVGGRFTAFEGKLRGKNLAIVPKRMIVQSWRAQVWKEPELDSILILTFHAVPGGAQVDLVQANVPDHAYDVISAGWHTYYWTPWKAYLAQQAGKG